MTDSSQSQKRRSRKIEEEEIMENLEANNSLINKLPDDCLKHIFSFLPILERLEAEKVCKRWHVIGKRGWNDINELEMDFEYSDNTVRLILKRCGRFVRKLVIYDLPEHPRWVSMIIKFCELDQLEDIEIHSRSTMRNFKGFFRNLNKIFEKTKKLAAVTIQGYNLSSSIDCLNFLNPETLQKLCLKDSIILDHFWNRYQSSINPDKFPNLRELKLNNIEIVGDKMKREERSLKELEKLELMYCDIPHSFIQTIATFSNLQELSFSRNNWDFKNEHIRDIAGHCEKLTVMCIDGFPYLTNDCFQYLGEMISLESLTLANFENVKSRDFMYLANVKHLDLCIKDDTNSGDSLIGLIANSSNLEKLGLYFLNHVDIAFVNDIRQIFHRDERKKHLDLTILYDKEKLSQDRQVVSDHPLFTVSYITY